MSIDQARLDRLALKRARAKLGFYIHATVFCVVNLGLVALSLSSGRHWAIYPLLGWGVGLLAHGLSVWVLPPGGPMFERMVQRKRARLTAGANGDLW
jgi:hypothetical protein